MSLCLKLNATLQSSLNEKSTELEVKYLHGYVPVDFLVHIIWIV